MQVQIIVDTVCVFCNICLSSLFFISDFYFFQLLLSAALLQQSLQR